MTVLPGGRARRGRRKSSSIPGENTSARRWASPSAPCTKGQEIGVATRPACGAVRARLRGARFEPEGGVADRQGAAERVKAFAGAAAEPVGVDDADPAAPDIHQSAGLEPLQGWVHDA